MYYVIETEDGHLFGLQYEEHIAYETLDSWAKRTGGAGRVRYIHDIDPMED